MRLRGVRLDENIIHKHNILSVKLRAGENYIDDYAPYLAIMNSKLRDMFIADLEQVNPKTRDLIKEKILFLTWERWVNAPGNDRGRTDISFAISGFEFIIECKRLKFADSKYIDEGIKRFVTLKYAEYDSCAGMIGFVIAGDIEKIVESLIQKVEDFHYTAGFDALLKKKCVNWEYSFQSRHNRDSSAPIHIYHLFFDFIQHG